MSKKLLLVNNIFLNFYYPNNREERETTMRKHTHIKYWKLTKFIFTVFLIIGISAELVYTVQDTYNETKEISNYKEMYNTKVEDRQKSKLIEQKLAEKRYEVKTIKIEKGETLYEAVKKNCQSTDNIEFICYMAAKENGIKDVKNIQPGTQIQIKIIK